jgi:hypothetical protein
MHTIERHEMEVNAAADAATRAIHVPVVAHRPR